MTKLSPIKVTIIYAFFACLWILFSDYMLALFVYDSGMMRQLQTVHNFDLNMLDVNKVVCTRLGYARDEIIEQFCDGRENQRFRHSNLFIKTGFNA
ncbi:MAG: hypothetical protein PHP23_00195 [Desulfobacterales bacterium]|nr:hypothetical protein [Desulfobacterales bacterium]MDD4071579.1 hypothetical protein [Desulfobacterales bacterium]MDD4391569.1 hypothetical protein [Desulfobacterales bacterium]